MPWLLRSWRQQTCIPCSVMAHCSACWPLQSAVAAAPWCYRSQRSCLAWSPAQRCRAGKRSLLLACACARQKPHVCNRHCSACWPLQSAAAAANWCCRSQRFCLAWSPAQRCRPGESLSCARIWLTEVSSRGVTLPGGSHWPASWVLGWLVDPQQDHGRAEPALHLAAGSCTSKPEQLSFLLNLSLQAAQVSV